MQNLLMIIKVVAQVPVQQRTAELKEQTVDGPTPHQVHVIPVADHDRRCETNRRPHGGGADGGCHVVFGKLIGFLKPTEGIGDDVYKGDVEPGHVSGIIIKTVQSVVPREKINSERRTTANSGTSFNREKTGKLHVVGPLPVLPPALPLPPSPFPSLLHHFAASGEFHALISSVVATRTHINSFLSFAWVRKLASKMCDVKLRHIGHRSWLFGVQRQRNQPDVFTV